MSTPPNTPTTPDPTVVDAVADTILLSSMRSPNVLAGRVIEKLGLDPGVSVARLREDLAIAQRARSRLATFHESSGGVSHTDFGRGQMAALRAVLGETDQP